MSVIIAGRCFGTSLQAAAPGGSAAPQLKGNRMCFAQCSVTLPGDYNIIYYHSLSAFCTAVCGVLCNPKSVAANVCTSGVSSCWAVCTFRKAPAGLYIRHLTLLCGTPGRKEFGVPGSPRCLRRSRTRPMSQSSREVLPGLPGLCCQKPGRAPRGSHASPAVAQASNGFLGGWLGMGTGDRDGMPWAVRHGYTAEEVQPLPSTR